MNECISCIKDGTTGICRDIKDKKSRELIAEITVKINEVTDTVNSLAGLDGGHLATDEDIHNLQSQITGLGGSVDDVVAALNSLDNTYAKDEDVNVLHNRMTSVEEGLTETENKINNLDNTYAKDTDITNLQNQVNSIQSVIDGLSGNVEGLVTTEEFTALSNSVAGLQTAINNLDNSYAKDSDIVGLQNQINEITPALNSVIDVVNALDNTYAKDTDITNLQTQINNLDNTYAKDTDITGLQTQINTINTDMSGVGEYIGEIAQSTVDLTQRVTALESAGGGSGGIKKTTVSSSSLYSTLKNIDFGNILKIVFKTTESLTGTSKTMTVATSGVTYSETTSESVPYGTFIFYPGWTNNTNLFFVGAINNNSTQETHLAVKSSGVTMYLKNDRIASSKLEAEYCTISIPTTITYTIYYEE